MCFNEKKYDATLELLRNLEAKLSSFKEGWDNSQKLLQKCVFMYLNIMIITKVRQSLSYPLTHSLVLLCTEDKRSWFITITHLIFIIDWNLQENA